MSSNDATNYSIKNLLIVFMVIVKGVVRLLRYIGGRSSRGKEFLLALMLAGFGLLVA